MKTYQTLSLIGNIFGILITIGLFMTGTFLVNFTENLSESEFLTPQDRQEQAQIQQSASIALGGFALAFIIYIVLLIITFVVKEKHEKALGIVFLIVGFLGVIATNGWGIIPYALLIPAGILAIREAKRHKEETTRTQGSLEGERKRYSFTEGWGDKKEP
ncbi:MAG TPA: DUF4064 domain-containing protein [Nitrososphaeraceae archaeon]|jgi:cytochrome bd-type quinol oxidase subunit 2|nr:DUF4064 domain-containing protein [Nitrososphaeraceae archaeon]